MAELDCKKAELCIESVEWHPEVGLLLVKMDLRAIGVNIEQANFIDLDPQDSSLDL